jgi:hypothetical protein
MLENSDDLLTRSSLEGRSLTTPIADPFSARIGEPDIPPGPLPMHRIDIARASYELDLVAPAA